MARRFSLQRYFTEAPRLFCPGLQVVKKHPEDTVPCFGSLLCIVKGIHPGDLPNRGQLQAIGLGRGVTVFFPNRQRLQKGFRWLPVWVIVAHGKTEAGAISAGN